MIRTHVGALALCVGLVVTSTHSMDGQTLSKYREFQLGSDVLSVAKQAGMVPSEAKVIHKRPALIQQLEWRLRYRISAATAEADPVREIRFRFYDDQLFRVVVDYDQDRTRGLTDADMTEMISTTYGLSKPIAGGLRIGPSDPDGGTPLAQWRDGDSVITLLRAIYPVTFRMVIASMRLETLAQVADAEALRLDEQEAPQRELARRTKEAEDKRSADEKARVVNKAAFRP